MDCDMCKNRSVLCSKIQGLRSSLNHHNYQYYVLDDPEVSDTEYDRIFHELASLESMHPEYT